MKYLIEKFDGAAATMYQDESLDAGDIIQTYSVYPNEIDATYIVAKVEEKVPCAACCFSTVANVTGEARGCILLGQDGEADCACPPGCAFKEIDEILEEL